MILGEDINWKFLIKNSASSEDSSESVPFKLSTFVKTVVVLLVGETEAAAITEQFSKD